MAVSVVFHIGFEKVGIHLHKFFALLGVLNVASLDGRDAGSLGPLFLFGFDMAFQFLAASCEDLDRALVFSIERSLI